MADERKIINGIVYGWGSLVIYTGSRLLPGISEISYQDNMDPKQVYGQGEHQAPQGQTLGKYNPGEPKMKLRQLDLDFLMVDLAAQSETGRSTAGVFFQIYVQGKQRGLPNRKDWLHNCTLKGIGESFKDDNEELVTEVTLTNQWVSRNGIVIFSDAGGLPDGSVSI